MKIKVTKELYSTRISKKLASSFIELGYGLQVEGMSAEMFFNRSFEPFYPYQLINKVWFDLVKGAADQGHEGARDTNVPYEKDWSIYDWYHSGYEHNAWFAFPGVAGKMLIEDESTFLIEKSPTHDVTIGYVDCDYHGKYAMKVTNDSDIWGGLAQDGKYCFENLRYLFRGAIKNICGAENIRIEVYREGETAQPVAVIPVEGITGELTVKNAEFTVPKEGRYTFAVVIPPHSQLLCDDFSLMPEDNINGWKKSAVEMGKYIAPGVIRFPGGCFTSFYDWHDGIGKNRKPDYSWFWGGYNYNDTGLDELAQYIESIGAEGMYCINMHHPFKKYYELVPREAMGMDPENPDIPGAGRTHRVMEEFSDFEKGLEEAANIVEYFNGDTSTFWGAKRAENGHKEPYHIRYWEMDNEACRWFGPKDYAEASVQYAKRMKQVDPSIKIGMNSYMFFTEQDLPEMLEIAGKDIDFIADRNWDEGIVTTKIDMIRSYNEKNGTNIKYCNTEWLPIDDADPTMKEKKLTCAYLFSKWIYALNMARILMMWQRCGDIFEFANFNNWANTHAQSAIETAKEGGYVAAAGEILRMFSHTKAAYVLKCEDYNPKGTDEFQVQISLNDEQDALVINVLNRTEQDEDVLIDVSEFLEAGTGKGVMLYADSPYSMNKLDDRGIKSKDIECCAKDGIVMIHADKYSYLETVITY